MNSVKLTQVPLTTDDENIKRAVTIAHNSSGTIRR